MMARVWRRCFTAEFKGGQFVFWETSGLIQAEVAGKLEIMPTMLQHFFGKDDRPKSSHRGNRSPNLRKTRSREL
ncbi:hypothetical protein ACVWZA_003601 [Sphingomonas sp. UYAg733]